MEPEEGPMKETPSSANISTKLLRIAELASKAPELAFSTLAHHLTIELVDVDGDAGGLGVGGGHQELLRGARAWPPQGLRSPTGA